MLGTSFKRARRAMDRWPLVAARCKGSAPPSVRAVALLRGSTYDKPSTELQHRGL